MDARTLHVFMESLDNVVSDETQKDTIVSLLEALFPEHADTQAFYLIPGTYAFYTFSGIEREIANWVPTMDEPKSPWRRVHYNVRRGRIIRIDDMDALKEIIFKWIQDGIYYSSYERENKDETIWRPSDFYVEVVRNNDVLKPYIAIKSSFSDQELFAIGLYTGALSSPVYTTENM